MNWIKGIGGGISCALVWWLMDRYVFGEVRDVSYYIAVVCAYSAGYGLPFSART